MLLLFVSSALIPDFSVFNSALVYSNLTFLILTDCFISFAHSLIKSSELNSTE